MPALLVGGGSGIVPLMAMLRLARASGRSDLARLIVSVRSSVDLYYADELPGPETQVVYTCAAPTGWSRSPGRLEAADLRGAVDAVDFADAGRAYVCGSPGFADGASRLLLDLDVPAERIRVERFGPSG